MHLSFRLAAVVTAAVFLTGCEALGVSRQVGYVAQSRGDFNGTGEFSADLAFTVDYGDGTFAGVLRDFRSTREGFDRPVGSIPLSGSVGRSAEGEVMFKGNGQGSLTQGNQEYLLAIEIESYYIDDRRNTVTGGLWGGGDFERAGAFVDWPAVKGEFRAKDFCRPNLLNAGPCPIPPPHPPSE